MRYVITGGAGYIGTRLVEQLVDRDDTERVVIADVQDVDVVVGVPARPLPRRLRVLDSAGG